MIVFQCNGAKIGGVEIGYLASYGRQWGSVKVSISQAIYSDPANPSVVFIEKEDSFVLHSEWKLHYSVRQEHTWQPSFSLGQRKIDHLNVTITACYNLGRKFKLLSIACC